MKAGYAHAVTILILVLWAGATAAMDVFVIMNVHVVPMDRETVLEHQAVVIVGDRIARVVNRDTYEPPANAHVVDAEGGYLIPGLADMHAHLRYDPEETFDLYCSNGVTTVRNMDYLDGGLDHVALRDEIAAGRRFGPRYILSGPVLNPRTLPNVQAVTPILVKHVERKIQYVKVHMDLDPLVYGALLTESKRLGLTVIGHAQRSRPLQESLRMYSIAHAEEFLYTVGRDVLADAAERSRVAREVAASGVFVSPTLVIYDTILDYVIDERFASLADRPCLQYVPAAERAQWLSPSENYYRRQEFNEARIARTRAGSEMLANLTLELHRAGVPLILGSDAFGAVVPGFAVHDELERLVEVGLSPYEALRTATVNVARYLHERDSGTVAEGNVADLVLLTKNPLAEISATRLIQGVFVRGRWLSSADREAKLRAIRERYASP